MRLVWRIDRTEETNLDKVTQDHVAMRLEDGKCYEEDKVVAVIVRPKHFPEPQHIMERELAFECNQYPARSCIRRGIWQTLKAHRKQKNRLRPSVFSIK